MQRLSISKKSQLDIILDKNILFNGFEVPEQNTLHGSLVFTPGSCIKVKRIVLQFEGRYVVSTSSDIRKSKTAFFETNWVFLDENRGKTFSGGLSNTFDFYLCLPTHLPESVRSQHGSIQYKFKAAVFTSLTHFNLKTEKPLCVQRQVDSLLTSRHITNISQSWRDMLVCSISIPGFRHAPGDEFPLKIQHQVTDDTKLVRILLAACMLKQSITYKSPVVPNAVIRETEKTLDMTFVWLNDDGVNGENKMMIKIPSSLKIYDSSNQYIEVTHRLQVRLDISYKGDLHNAYHELPILISSQNHDASEALPLYHLIPGPPSYESVIQSDAHPTIPTVALPLYQASVLTSPL
ncbi:hypothetical protein K493DRAFT_308929 [Basidiobolus meristosporus CBS 931.73]|uniref:Uncharacterized protein n=1 Tax=Basidiobolus meristosporus CBS 931.73 TaxID=1314790 RepID=A0A1Y1WUW0_9FUNG|nr:hypothetical protein K493DRAFT_308929 [Basidiobolus meristosporus CBS 931.73]|eukprot:ORX77195.1 hypothetical protein K493DRAFT_308929 [Basidiobolus meristosporus CBS 931.73]